MTDSNNVALNLSKTQGMRVQSQDKTSLKATNLKQHWLMLLEQQDLLLSQTWPSKDTSTSQQPSSTWTLETDSHSSRNTTNSAESSEVLEDKQEKSLPGDFPSNDFETATFNKINDQATSELSLQQKNTKLLNSRESTFSPTAMHADTTTLVTVAELILPCAEKSTSARDDDQPTGEFVNKSTVKNLQSPHGESDSFRQHHISITKMSDGYTIWARDYRLKEKDNTKKIVTQLKTILLASGEQLKNVVMNGKKLN